MEFGKHIGGRLSEASGVEDISGVDVVEAKATIHDLRFGTRAEMPGFGAPVDR